MRLTDQQLNDVIDTFINKAIYLGLLEVDADDENIVRFTDLGLEVLLALTGITASLANSQPDMAGGREIELAANILSESLMLQLLGNPGVAS